MIIKPYENMSIWDEIEKGFWWYYDICGCCWCRWIGDVRWWLLMKIRWDWQTTMHLVTPILIYHLNLYLIVVSCIYGNVAIYCCCVTDPREHHGRSRMNRLCLALSYIRHEGVMSLSNPFCHDETIDICNWCL